VSADDAADRETLGAEIRARREAIGLGLRELARIMRRSPTMLSDVETGKRIPGADHIAHLACELNALASVDRWYALAGHVDPELIAALLAAPERWGDVRALLAGGGE
jgi:transcriptional regulator with XRE-family HTH domain